MENIINERLKSDPMVKIVKRDGSSIVEYNPNKIINVITKAMKEDKKLGVNLELAKKIEHEIYDELLYHREMNGDLALTVESIQDMCEDGLLRHGRKDTAKDFIRYRNERNKEGHEKNSDENVEKYINLTDDFISYFKHKPNPFPTPMSEIVFYRTYSRFLKRKMRREKWYETVRRAVEYNTTLKETTKEEAQELFKLMYNLKGFLSGRTLYSGNTYVSRNFPMSNYNCSFQVTDNIKCFTDGFYLLLLGCGYGFRVFKKDIDKLPKFRTDIELIHQHYKSIPKGSRSEHTNLEFHGETMAQITVSDSKIGWVKAMEYYLKLMTDPMYFSVNTIILNYDNVRPFGEKLLTFGGSASGYQALEKMIEKTHNTILNRGKETGLKKVQLTSVDCLDIHTSIAEGVVVGGTRRSAEISLGEVDDINFITAKKELYTKDSDDNWIINESILNRQMSNNTILFEEKPSKEKLSELIKELRYNGEPGFYNGEEAKRRNKFFSGTNACSEILLDSEEMCNLVTMAVNMYVEDKILNEHELLKGFKLITRANLRMSCVELELPEWNKKQQRDRLLGVSLTGWQDMVNLTNMSKEKQAELLRKIRKAIHTEAKDYSKELGVNEPLLSTCVKPEGTLSQLPLASSGLHFTHSEFFIRRVRMNALEPLTKVCEDLGYPTFPEVGQTLDDCKTKVVEFPIKAPSGKTKYNVSAIEQLEIYKMFMENYVDMNASITVHVREHEWEAVEEWVWNNWDSIIGISFLSLDDNFYKLLPYESITEEEYLKRVSEMKEFNPTLISEYEKTEYEADMSLNSSCDTGHCPVR